MKRRMRASMTVEAALLYPCMLLITFLLVKLTVYQYLAVNNGAAKLYDAVFTEKKMEAPDLLRISDMAFDIFGK